MKILLVNKFLYPKGGAETYIIKLGKKFEQENNEVQYFGLYDEINTLTNRYNIYAKRKDFQNNKSIKFVNPFSLIYSLDAKNKLFLLLKKYEPDMIILNNIEYHLTPSIILAIEKYKKRIGKKVKLFYVAHDYQLVCPSHGLFDININPCEKCLPKCNYWNCLKTKCLKNSRLKSLVGTMDAFYWKKRKVYRFVDYIICPSNFLKTKLETRKDFLGKTILLHNFIENNKIKKQDKSDYIIYFGKLCKDKGVETLLKVAKKLKDIKFIFAGYGPLEKEIDKIKNAEYVGFKNGKELINLVSKAQLSVCPSECFENCPFSVIESQMYGTPVIGSNRGGIPELIDINKTGIIFKAGNEKDLAEKINKLYNDKKLLKEYTNNCFNKKFIDIDTYYNRIIELYNEKERIE